LDRQDQQDRAADRRPQPVRGMNDVLAVDMRYWQFLEREARALFAEYGYQEIRVPIVEHTPLFQRAIGEFTDVVEKEMYTFVDRSGDSLTLRPEATAGVVRAAISNGLLHNQKHRLWTSGPMFRHERPQKGRYRQFHQIGCEAFGYEGPDIDAELILLSARLWRRIGIERVRLSINSLGTPDSRRAYRELLVAYFERHRAALDDDSLRRLGGNPLRILDSKNPALAEVIAGAPVLTEHLDAASQAHFDGLKAVLADNGVQFTVNPRLVRGLDYYSRTVFEWTTDALGSQDAVCSGGRYDGLVEQLGGEPTPAVGWALGVERIVGLLQQFAGDVPDGGPQVYLVLAGAVAERRGLKLAEELRDALPGVRLQANLGGGGIKAQLKRADRSGATVALLLGDDELARGIATVKPLRADVEQMHVAFADLPARLRPMLETG
jgi:histidyl-tRNA synthetase